mgnify:CR=1 FL=1
MRFGNFHWEDAALRMAKGEPGAMRLPLEMTKLEVWLYQWGSQRIEANEKIVI